jgi:hypothetical protein
MDIQPSLLCPGFNAALSDANCTCPYRNLSSYIVICFSARTAGVHVPPGVAASARVRLTHAGGRPAPALLTPADLARPDVYRSK